MYVWLHDWVSEKIIACSAIVDECQKKERHIEENETKNVSWRVNTRHSEYFSCLCPFCFDGELNYYMYIHIGTRYHTAYNSLSLSVCVQNWENDKNTVYETIASATYYDKRVCVWSDCVLVPRSRACLPNIISICSRSHSFPFSLSIFMYLSNIFIQNIHIYENSLGCAYIHERAGPYTLPCFYWTQSMCVI